MSPLLTPPMSNRPSEKENVPFAQPPSSPKKLLDAFQLSPRTPRSSPQRSTKCSPRPPVSPRSSPNRSRGHLRSTLNLHPPSLLTKTRSHRVSFAQRDSHHLYTTPLRALPSYSSRPAAFIAARSILKSRTPERVVVPDPDESVEGAAPKLNKREMSPVPDDPLRCPTYLSSPVSTIVGSVSITPSPNRIDSDMMDVCGPLPMSLHDLAEAYTLLLARLRLQAMTVGPDGVATDTEITPELPLLQPIQQHHSDLATALARDVARALVKPVSFTAPTPYQPLEVDDWSSDYSSDVYGSSSPPGSPSGPTQKRGLTAAEVKYARDLSLVSQSAIRVLAVVFHEPAVSSHFTDDELIEMLKVLISIPNTMPLPTPNPRKTHTAALWALQMIRLPLSIMHSPGVVDSLFVALQMAVQGKLGREGKKGSTSEGLTAVQLLTSHYPSIFGPMLPILMSDLVKCLSSPMPIIRQRAALALGGIVQGLFDWEEEEEVSAADSKKPLDLSAVHAARKEISEALLDTFDLEKNAKNAMLLKNVKDILSQFSPEASVIGVRAGDTPHWAFSVLASLVTLLERNFFACNALHTSVLTCGRIALNAKKAAIRTAGGLLWGCVVWAWKRYDAQDESRGESEESMKNEKIMAQVVVENIGFGVVAALLETKDRSEVVATRRLRRVCRCVKSMVEERCWGAPELLGRLLSTEESPSASATPAAIERKLVPTSLLTQQLAGADLKALAIAVNSCVSQGVKPEEVRPLTMDERVAEWPQLFSTWKHFPGWIPTTDEGEPAEVLLQTWRALLLATTNVQDHIPCFVAIAEALTAFANSKHEDPKQTALTLTFVRRLWLIVHEVFFNPLSSNTLLADFSADLIQTLAQRPPELGKKIVRESWVTLLAEVLASGTLDSTETLCDVLPESLWGSVYAGVVNKYAEDPNFEGGLVLCGVPFNESYAWVLSEDDWNAWSSLAHALIVSEGEQVFSNLLTMIGAGQTIPIPSTLRPLSILLSFSELPVSESDGVFSNLLNMANDRLRAEYSSCLSPETLEAVLDLISALRGIITPDAMCLEVIESVQSGMQLWIEDEQFALSDQEFNDGPVLFYAHAMQGLTAVPDELLDLGKLAPFLASAFTRIPPPGAGPLAFSLFWNQKFAGRGPPEGGYPEILKPCLRGILNIEELIEGGISLGTDIGEETQPKYLPAPATTVDDNAGIAGDGTSAKSVEQPGASSEVANTSIESVEMADATNQSDDTRTEEETVESSVEEIDELLDDSDIVEETIVYEPPSRPDSPSSLVPARASTPIPRPAQLEVQPQAESQCVSDSQVETTETAAEDACAEPVMVSVCESPRKRKYEAATLPSKRPKGLFVADPEIESLPILRFPARSRSSSPGSVVEESIFYSPDKLNVPPPAWSPTGVSQLLPALPVAEPVSAPAEETVEISLSEVIETSAKDSVDEPAETSVDESVNTSVDESANTSIDDLPDNDLNDLPDITMSLPIRKKRMTFVVEVPRVSEVLKRWSSDSATAKSVPATTPRKKKPGMPERVRRTRSWSKLPQMAAVPPELESTPLRRPLKRRRSDRDSSGELSIELGRSRKNSRSSTSSGDLTITPKQLLTADMFDGASPDDTPSLRRVRSMPLSAKKAAVGSVGRAASLAASKASTESASESLKNTASAAQVENEISVENGDIATTTATTPTLAATATTDISQTSTTEPVTRTASLEALMADADTLAKLDVAELIRQEEMLAAMKEQVARALAMKRAASVVSNTGRDFSF